MRSSRMTTVTVTSFTITRFSRRQTGVWVSSVPLVVLDSAGRASRRAVTSISEEAVNRTMDGNPEYSFGVAGGGGGAVFGDGPRRVVHLNDAGLLEGGDVTQADDRRRRSSLAIGTRRHVPRLRTAALVAAMALLVAIAGCGNDGDEPAPIGASAASTTTIRQNGSSQPSSPVGIIGLGHSGMTGGNSNPERPGRDAKENSWATGTTPEVNSIYRRLVAVRPETEGHVANLALGGSNAAALAGQAVVALDRVPAPALVIIQAIDNDIRCDGSDAANLDDFGNAITDALRVISDSSPQTKILVVSQLGRPATYAAAVAPVDALKAGHTGGGMCDLFDRSGALAEKRIAALTSIIESYEAEQARRCAAVPQCSTDGGRAATFVDRAEDFADPDHLKVSGLARWAEHQWPTVAQLLEVG